MLTEMDIKTVGVPSCKLGHMNRFLNTQQLKFVIRELQ